MASMEYVPITAEIMSVTEDAILLSIESENYWLPRSAIESGFTFTEFSDVSEFYIREWILIKEGLI